MNVAALLRAHCLCCVLLSASSVSVAGELVFHQAGFRISSIEATPGDVPTQALVMSLPPEMGFSANVNVQIQPYSGSIEEYKRLSDIQFYDLEFNVYRSDIAENTAIFEYAGKLNETALHWYAKAVKADDHVYLVTATSLEALWDKYRSRLITAVESFVTTAAGSAVAADLQR